MLRAICAGQPKCSAIQPSQAVATVSEKHITANQSSVLTTPRRSVGRENAARIAQGTASMMNSESVGSSRKNSSSPAQATATSGSQMWGAYSQSRQDRKSTRLNSSHVKISYAVFCLKKKTNDTREQ